MLNSTHLSQWWDTKSKDWLNEPLYLDLTLKRIFRLANILDIHNIGKYTLWGLSEV